MMDGGRSYCIEEHLRNGGRKVNIRENMKKKGASSCWEVICLLL